MTKNKLKLGLGVLTVLATPIVVNTVASSDVHAEYRGSIFYYNNKPANWWYSDGNDWYFFQNGRKLTGYGKDNAGTHYFVNGKYANGKIGNKIFKDGKELSVENSIPVRGYANGVYYVDSKLANWWYDDGQAWYFFQNGKKLTGYGKDNAGTHYFVNGKYANGKIGNKEYRDGKEISVENKVPTRGYANGVYYVDSKPANWWYDDGQAWYFFQNGKKLTGYGKDNAGMNYFYNGKYANWWYNDGQDWYFFQNGKKLTGYGKDNAGTHYFVNGKYQRNDNNSYSGYYKVKSLYIPVYDANGRILSHVSKDTVLFRDNRSTANGRIPVQVAGLTGYVNASQVTAVDSSNTFIPDYVSDGTYVYHRYSPYTKVMVAHHNANMQVGKSYYSADGINFGTFKLDHPFQFSNLKSRTNYTAADINRLYSIMGASDSKLAGKGATFKAAEQRYGVNALYLVAHSALESAWGRSKIAKDKNNFFGIAAYDDTPYTSATKFDNVDSGIMGAARWINSRYLNNSGYPANGAYLGNKAGGMNVNYATAPYWGESIASIMFSANEKLGRKDR